MIILKLNFSQIPKWKFDRLVRTSIAAGLMLVLQESVGRAQQSLNVTNYGAFGDAAWIAVNCVSNSYTVTTTNLLSSADVGKVIEIFGGGPRATSANAFQDNIAIIQSVSQQTNLVLNRACQNTTNLTYAFYGTECATGFQACVNASSNSIINIPSGNYLLIPPALLDTNYNSSTGPYFAPAVTLYQYGQHFLGAGATNTILYGCGAFRTYPAVVRGVMFYEPGGESNYIGTLAFDSLTMDGGVTIGDQHNAGWPADNNGNGWDITHDAVLSGTTTPATNTVFVNCNIQHWRGEMLKSTYDFQSANFTGITNCNFIDGDASALNWQVGAHVVTGCTFNTVELVEEFEQHVSSLPCYFINNYITNCYSGLTISGANTNYLPQAPYLVQSNTFQVSQWGVSISPAENVTINGNYYYNSGYALLLAGVGSQGNASISNIVFINNVATNSGTMIVMYSGGYLYVTNNFFSGSGNSDIINGGTTSGNIFMYGNTAINLGSGGIGCLAAYPAQLPLDDLSNKFPFEQIDNYATVTNYISYSTGARHFVNQEHAGSVYCLDDAMPSQIPVGAAMIVTNAASNLPISLFSSSISQVAPVTLTQGASVTFYWNHLTSNWTTKLPAVSVLPPSNLRARTINP
jgi:hypothetical protein